MKSIETMNKEELTARFEKVSNKRFTLAGRKNWSDDDFALDDKLYREEARILQALEKLG